MLCCLGDLVEDIVVHLGGAVAVGTDTDAHIVRRRGGSAANVAVSAASRTQPVRFIGCVGDDAVGEMLVGALRALGVDPAVQRKGRSGSIVVLVDAAGERSMLRDRAAAAQLDVVPSGDLEDVSWLHVPAYSFAGGPIADAAAGAIEAVASSGGAVSIDASSVAVIDEMGIDRFRDLIQSFEPDVLFCNAEEADRLIPDPSQMVFGRTLIVVKRGSGPATAMGADGVIASVAAHDLGAVPDTTGAGDAFAAGYVVAAMEGRDVEACLAAGHGAAASLLRANDPKAR
ncbi:MAG: PfkB family carbohydrate kinase [Acidimicrobiia bacterium]|nr:PfkB family carbohydrate kinase [Acidimicrobiia bacterium]